LSPGALIDIDGLFNVIVTDTYVDGVIRFVYLKNDIFSMSLAFPRF